MKTKIKVLLFILLAGTLMFGGIAMAQDEPGGVKKAWRGFLDVFRGEDEEKTPQAQTKPEAKKKEAAPRAAQAPVGPERPQRVSIKDMNEVEISARIKVMLDTVPEIADVIPGLRIKLDKDDNLVSATYTENGITKDLEELDRQTLMSLYNRVNNERIRIQTEQIEDQMNAIRAAQNIPRPVPASPAQAPAAMPSPPPSTPTPPPSAPPAVPSTPPQQR